MLPSPQQSETDEVDLHMMTLALEEARKCEPKQTAFSVGCVLAFLPKEAQPIILSRGYSRELEGNTHAEANALAKAWGLSKDYLRLLLSSVPGYSPDEDGSSIETILRASTVYTTMEPCSVRTSGLAPCADALISAGISRCVIGVAEPDDFVKCEGAQKLMDAGIQVTWLHGLERECLEVARKWHSEAPSL